MKGLLRKLLGPWRRQLYTPNAWLGPLANPFYVARRGLWLAMLDLAPRLQGRLLDVGCGNKPYADLFAHMQHVGLEIDSPATRAHSKAEFFYDGGRMPFKAASYDAVLINQVLEHVFEPEAFLRELHRVLKPGGLLLVTVPFVWDEHCQPADFARYTRFGLGHLLKKQGFQVLVHLQTGSGLQAVTQLTAGAVYKVTVTWPRVLGWLPHWLVIVPLNLAGALAGLLGLGGQDLYLDNVALAQAVPIRRSR